MNENSSKQVLLSVIGIAVLVVAVVGVSFAFFTYSKGGTKNNTLTTGSIFFDFTEGNFITLTNQFPMADSAGEALTTDGNGALEFTVKGYDSSKKGIAYTVYAVPGNTDGSKNRFKDSEIKLNLVAPKALTNNYLTSKAVGENDSLTASGIVLATGKITAESLATQQEDKYTLRMWISDTVTIGATGATYTEAQFANLYYSLKIKVVANTAA